MSIREVILGKMDVQVRALLGEVEEHCGVEVEFREDRSRRVPAQNTSHDGLKLVVPSIAKVTSQELLHEILHMKQYGVDSVPRMVFATDQLEKLRGQAMVSIDNDIEHLRIVPMETTYGYEPFGYWTEHFRGTMKRYPWGLTGTMLRLELTGGMLAYPLLNDDQTKRRYREILRQNRLKEEFNLMLQAFSMFADDKLSLSRHVLNALNIPLEDVRLYYPDVRNHRYELTEFPSSQEQLVSM